MPPASLTPSLAPWVIARLHDLVQRVPVVQLHLRPDDSYWPALEPYLAQVGQPQTMASPSGI